MCLPLPPRLTMSPSHPHDSLKMITIFLTSRLSLVFFLSSLLYELFFYRLFLCFRSFFLPFVIAFSFLFVLSFFFSFFSSHDIFFFSFDYHAQRNTMNKGSHLPSPCLAWREIRDRRIVLYTVDGINSLTH